MERCSKPSVKRPDSMNSTAGTCGDQRCFLVIPFSNLHAALAGWWFKAQALPWIQRGREERSTKSLQIFLHGQHLFTLVLRVSRPARQPNEDRKLRTCLHGETGRQFKTRLLHESHAACSCSPNLSHQAPHPAITRQERPFTATCHYCDAA